jgi:hypothetical protein
MDSAGPFVGRLFDRVAPRSVYTLGLGLLGTGLSLASRRGPRRVAAYAQRSRCHEGHRRRSGRRVHEIQHTMGIEQL